MDIIDFNQLLIDHIFETTKKGVRISVDLAEFLGHECKDDVRWEFSSFFKTEFFWNRDSSIPFSKDPFILAFFERMKSCLK